MTSVYIVTSDDGSTFEIHAVCASHEDAELIVGTIGGDLYGADIQEHVICTKQAAMIREGFRRWCVQVGHDGSCEAGWCGDIMEEDQARMPYVWKSHFPNIPHLFTASYYCWAKDGDDAIGKAKAWREKMIAEGRWDIPERKKV